VTFVVLHIHINPPGQKSSVFFGETKKMGCSFFLFFFFFFFFFFSSSSSGSFRRGALYLEFYIRYPGSPYPNFRGVSLQQPESLRRRCAFANIRNGNRRCGVANQGVGRGVYRIHDFLTVLAFVCRRGERTLETLEFQLLAW